MISAAYITGMTVLSLWLAPPPAKGPEGPTAPPPTERRDYSDAIPSSGTVEPPPGTAVEANPSPSPTPAPAPGAPAPDVSGAGLDFGDDAMPSELDLRRTTDGEYAYVDPGGRFTARFHDDGTVTFADPWHRHDKTHPGRGKFGGLPVAGVPGLNPFAGMAMTGPVEWAMLARGWDPSRTAKADLLERTHELRTKLAVAHAKARIDERLGTFDLELLAIWTDHEKPRPARREALFERWDECDERFAVAPEGIPLAAVSDIDRYRLEAATTARAKVITFVRRHLPASSKHRYTRAELDALNARRVSHDRFTPYGAR